MEKLIPVEMNINNQHYKLEVSSSKRLLDVLREDLNLTATKDVAALESVARVLYSSTAKPCSLA